MATANATIYVQRPITETAGTDHMEREQRFDTPGVELRAWAVPIRAQRAVYVLGVLTDRAVQFRFRAPGLDRPIKAGWRIVHEGETYEVRTATNISGLWNVMGERAG